MKELCKEWFPIQYPETWYRDITSDPRFYSLAAVYQSQLVGLLIAEVKSSDAINKEVSCRPNFATTLLFPTLQSVVDLHICSRIKGYWMPGSIRIAKSVTF